MKWAGVAALALGTALWLACAGALPDRWVGVDAGDLLGPMVGHVGPDEALIWAAAQREARLEIAYAELASGAEAAATRRVVLQTKPEARFAVRARITGLTPDTAYTYRVRLDGRTHPDWQGRFRTAPPLRRPGRFRMAFSSCMHARRHPSQPAWRALLRQSPVFQLLLGDNVYANSTRADVLWEWHGLQRRVGQFAQVIRQVPTYAVWDDHDYAANDSDGTEPGKSESLKTFRQLFANPDYGAPGVPGTFFRFSWGDVDFFVLDTRYHRSPNLAPDDEHKRMLGDAQFAWLVRGLRSSKARFKVLASGSTLRTSPDDGWRVYGFARRRLFRAIAEHGIEGVLYLSGDSHRCLIDVHDAQETGGYPIYEIISSGIANSVSEGFVTLDFDTLADVPSVEVRILQGDGSVAATRRISLSELQ